MNLVITKYLGLALLVIVISAGVLSGLGKDGAKAWEAAGLIAAGLIGVVRQDHPDSSGSTVGVEQMEKNP